MVKIYIKNWLKQSVESFIYLLINNCDVNCLKKQQTPIFKAKVLFNIQNPKHIKSS